MLQEIVGKEDFQQFLQAYFSFPFALPAVAKKLTHYLDPIRFEKVGSLVPERDVLVVKNGKIFPSVVPRRPEEFHDLRQKGYSIVLRHAEHFDDGLQELAHSLGRELNGIVAVQLYCTPSGCQGFGWHYDAEEVFILQTEGCKNYWIRRNTITPRPLPYHLPSEINMQYERETSELIGSTLIAGDWLYIPSGWWHCANAVENSFSISMGLMPLNKASMFCIPVS